jgi:hypothetical protein
VVCSSGRVSDYGNRIIRAQLLAPETVEEFRKKLFTIETLRGRDVKGKCLLLCTAIGGFLSAVLRFSV